MNAAIPSSLRIVLLLRSRRSSGRARHVLLRSQMGRNVLAGRLLDDGGAHLGHVVHGGRADGEESRQHRPHRHLVEQVEVLLIDLLPVELVDVEAIIDLHARIAGPQNQIAAVRSPRARRDVVRVELHDPLPVHVVPDEDVPVEVPEALRIERVAADLRREEADGRAATRAACSRSACRSCPPPCSPSW